MKRAGQRPLELWLPMHAHFGASHPLQTLLAQADREAAGPRGHLAGLAAYFDADRVTLPAAALTRQWYAHDAGDARWLCADPAWVQPDINGVRLMACGQLGLRMDEAVELATALRPLFDEVGLALELSAPDRWHLRLPPALPLPDLATPEQALGEDLYQHLPVGAAGKFWRVLQNDIQVTLHQHPLNAQRRARGLSPVNSLWLWGAGCLPQTLRSPLEGVFSDDPLLCALAAHARLTRRARAPEAVAAASAGWLVDLQDLPAAQIERDWWPAIATLAQNRPVRFAFASGERWLHKPLHRWRFWRRAAR